jgi:hypothetical protein
MLDVLRVQCKKRKSCCRSHPLSAIRKLLAQSRLHGQGQQLTLQTKFQTGRKRKPDILFDLFYFSLRYFMELAELAVENSPAQGRKRGTVGLMLWPAKNKELIITGKTTEVGACLSGACKRCPSLQFKRQVLT